MENKTAIVIQIATVIICFIIGLIGAICLFINGFTLWAYLVLAGLALYNIGAFSVVGGLVR